MAASRGIGRLFGLSWHGVAIAVAAVPGLRMVVGVVSAQTGTLVKLIRMLLPGLVTMTRIKQHSFPGRGYLCCHRIRRVVSYQQRDYKDPVKAFSQQSYIVVTSSPLDDECREASPAEGDVI